MKIAICYASYHHGNTKKLVEGIKDRMDVDLIDVIKEDSLDLSAYDWIGFASGIYFGYPHERIESCIREMSFHEGQHVFLIATCGVAYRNYTKHSKELLKEKGITAAGSFQCRGFDTFGVFAKIGGIAKKHPNEKDVQRACQFLQGMISS